MLPMVAEYQRILGGLMELTHADCAALYVEGGKLGSGFAWMGDPTRHEQMASTLREMAESVGQQLGDSRDESPAAREAEEAKRAVFDFWKRWAGPNNTQAEHMAGGVIHALVDKFTSPEELAVLAPKVQSVVAEFGAVVRRWQAAEALLSHDVAADGKGNGRH